MRKISAIMVTGKDRGVENLPQMAVRCFLSQTYPAKELIIINHGTKDYSGKDVRDIKVKLEPGMEIGTLRNMAFKFVTGDYMMTWDDDDWQHPTRMEFQSARTRDGCSSVLSSRIVHDFETGSSFYRTTESGFFASLMHPSDTDARYKNFKTGSSWELFQQFPCRQVLENPPHLYIYNVHGKNLNSRDYLLRDMDRCETLKPEDAALVDLLPKTEDL